MSCDPIHITVCLFSEKNAKELLKHVMPSTQVGIIPTLIDNDRWLSNSGSLVKLSWPKILAGFTAVYEVVTGVAAGSLQGSVQSARASQGIRRVLRTVVRVATNAGGLASAMDSIESESVDTFVLVINPLIYQSTLTPSIPSDSWGSW